MSSRKLSHTQKLDGVEGITVGDFWAWAYSDILNNRNRGVFAEFLVGTALDVIDQPRIEWDAVDLRYKGKNIEVKSSAYLQSWAQNKPSTIIFDVAPRLGWDSATNMYATLKTRLADCYVFCLYSQRELNEVNVLNVNDWHFYVLPTLHINQLSETVKTIGLARLQKLCQPVTYEQLKDKVDSILEL